MPHSPHSGRVAALSRRCPSDDPRLVAAKLDLAVHQLEDFIGRRMAGLPPLRPEQRARIVALLESRETVR